MWGCILIRIPLFSQANNSKTAPTKRLLIKEKVAECRHICTELELHKYVDGGLSSAERDLVLGSAMQSAKIRAELNELEQLRSQVRNSYK